MNWRKGKPSERGVYLWRMEPSSELAVVRVDGEAAATVLNNADRMDCGPLNEWAGEFYGPIEWR